MVVWMIRRSHRVLDRCKHSVAVRADVGGGKRGQEGLTSSVIEDEMWNGKGLNMLPEYVLLVE